MMRRRLFSIGSTEVYFHLATLMLVVYMVMLKQAQVLVFSMLSILVHEAAHAVASTCMGKPPREIEITPLGGMMRLEEDGGLSTIRLVLVLLAGPFASLGLCWLSLWLTNAGVLSAEIGRQLFMSNLLFLVGNMLPALPMDGGRVVALLLAFHFRRETVNRIMRALGTTIGFGFIILNLVFSMRYGGWNLSLSMSGCFLMYAAAHCTTTSALAELRAFMDRKNRLECKEAVPCKWVTIMNHAPLCKAIKQLAPNGYTMFACVDPSGLSAVRVVEENELIAAYLADPSKDINDVQGLEKWLFH